MKMKKKIPTEEELTNLKVKSWGTWSKEVSEFDWSYGDFNKTTSGGTQ